jgi:hypothetical protein
MRKGCRAHIQRKVVVRDDAVMASVYSQGKNADFRRNSDCEQLLIKFDPHLLYHT